MRGGMWGGEGWILYILYERVGKAFLGLLGFFCSVYGKPGEGSGGV